MNNRSIKIGNLVCIEIAWWKYVGVVTKEDIWAHRRHRDSDPVGYLISIPGKEDVERSFAKCNEHDVTEEQRKIYFKNVLKYD